MIKNNYLLNLIDHRDWDFHKTFGTVIMNLPNELILDAGLWIPNQNSYEPIFGNPSMPYGCTDYTSNDVCANQDGILYNPAFTESVTHANTTGGTDIRTSLLSTIKQGTQTKDGTIVKRTGVFNVQKYDILDYFDSIRYAMLPTLGEKRTVSWGTPWFPEWETEALQNKAIMIASSNYDTTNLGWHNSEFVGWKTINGTPYLVNKSWQGDKVGDNGFLYFSRDIVNSVMKINGTCAFTVSKLQNGLPPKNISTSFLEWIYSILRNIFNPSFKPSPEPSIVSAPTTNTPSLPPVTPKTDSSTITVITPSTSIKYLWDNPINTRHSIRVICDEEGLSLNDKNIITACIHQESSFDNTVICKNKSADGSIWSSDWGIVQINDYYNIGVGKPFPSVQYVLEHEEECVRWMIKMMKEGKLSLWSSYKSGAYKQWLV